MSDENHNKLAARIVAHERLIAFLLSFHLKGMSGEQEKLLEAVLAARASIPSFGSEIDIGTADDLAGLVLDYKSAIDRIFQTAIAIADNKAHGGSR